MKENEQRKNDYMGNYNSLKTSTRKSWNYLTSHFTPEYIETMTDMKEYVVGFGSNNKSFCYLVEVGLKELGDIRGATSAKFGLWYGTHGQDKTVKYRTTKSRFNGDVDVAFVEIKKALAKLIRETQKLSEFKDLKSIINGMFKYKIMYLYNPDIMLPSFVLEDIQYFESKLRLEPSDTYEKAQKQLLLYKQNHHTQYSNHEFMKYLYTEYGRNTMAQVHSANEEKDAALNKKVYSCRSQTSEYVTKIQPKVKPKRTATGIAYYPRNYKMALYALVNAAYKCENDTEHHCFTKRNGDPYTEVHHLIPLCYYDEFDVSLDVPENIISLCSSCHNEIHYGLNADQIIKKLFYEREAKLKAAGICISLEQLLDMYDKINKQG